LTMTLGNGLQYLTSLTSLDLSHNSIGWKDSLGEVTIGNSLQYLNSLTMLDLSDNYIGWEDSRGEIAIGNSLGSLTSLKVLQLSSNRIGSTDGEGSQAILLALPKLQPLNVLDLKYMTNITWTEGAEALAGLNRERLRTACEAELCFATPINPILRPSGYYSGGIHIETLDHYAITLGNATRTLTPEEIRGDHTVDITAPGNLFTSEATLRIKLPWLLAKAARPVAHIGNALWGLKSRVTDLIIDSYHFMTPIIHDALPLFIQYTATHAAFALSQNLDSNKAYLPALDAYPLGGPFYPPQGFNTSLALP
jgi:hypothetical protein